MSQLSAGTVRMFVYMCACVEEKERRSLCINRV